MSISIFEFNKCVKYLHDNFSHVKIDDNVTQYIIGEDFIVTYNRLDYQERDIYIYYQGESRIDINSYEGLLALLNR